MTSYKQSGSRKPIYESRPGGLQRILAITCAITLSGCASHDSAIHARVVPPITGAVQVNGSPAKVNDPLNLGDILTAKGDDATVSVKFEDGAVLHLYGIGAPGGEAKLVVTAYDSGTKAMAARLFGGILSLVSPPKNPPPRKTIEALNTTTSTEGTEVKIASTTASDTVSLKSGKVSVSPKNGGPAVSLTPGQQVQVEAGKAPGAAAPYKAEADEKFFIGPNQEVDKHY